MRIVGSPGPPGSLECELRNKFTIIINSHSLEKADLTSSVRHPRLGSGVNECDAKAARTSAVVAVLYTVTILL
jgi:hypothetical protein